jgi:hypothetical protein
MSNSSTKTAHINFRGLRRLTVCIALLTLMSPGAVLQAQEMPTPKPYEPYAFLIGEWAVGPEGGQPRALMRFRWGPKKTYIWYSGAFLINGREQPTYEGILVWNGMRHNLDMLLVLDLSLGSLVEEQGTVSLEPDGSVVRDVTTYYSEGNALPPDWRKAAGPEGAKAHFRHSFKQISPGRLRTSIMRETDKGWVPNFPGSDALIMVKRSAG